ncbi:MAG: hypothetical protein K0B11_14350 [Mariniphaga sp.]|nr:hypothetical protein [Mariniphaga sp.]
MKRIDIQHYRFLTFLPYLLFFVVTFVFFFWFAGYIFFYQEKLSLFLVSKEFILEYLSQPGGFLKYFALFLSAFYRFEILGACIVSFIILFVVWFLALTGKELTVKPVYFLPFLVGAGLAFLHTNYQFQLVNSLGILLQLVWFYVTIRFLGERTLWLPVLLFPVWYFLAGGFAWLYLLMFSLFLATGTGKNRWLQLGALLLVACLSFFISSEFLFYETTKTMLQYPFSDLNSGMQTREFALLAGLIGLCPLLFKINIHPSKTSIARKVSWMQFFPFLVIPVLAGVLSQRTDRKNSHYFHVEKLFYERKFDEIIAFNKTFPTTNKLTLFLNNIALAETGQLTERLFEFPQSPDGETLFLKWETMGEVLRRGGHFYYTVGLVNEAHRWAYEYMVIRGYTPEGLKMLIKTELINGNYKVASKYIEILSQSVFYRNEAREFLKLLDNEAVKNHPELGQKKRFKPKTDFFVLSEVPPANLEPLLEADSTHIFAIEYQFAWLLLQKDVQAVVEHLPLLEKAGYNHIPRHINEAAIGFKLLKMGEFPQLEFLRTSAETEQRFRQYYQIFQQHSNSREQAQRALYPQFSDTFWYYLFFN